MREILAEYAHKQWSGWMEYIFSKTVNPIEPDGTVIIPKWAVDRWKRQMKTSYKDLSEDEKESDRSEADGMLEILTNNNYAMEKPMENKVIFESEEEFDKFYDDCMLPDCQSEIDFKKISRNNAKEQGYIRKSQVEEAEEIFYKWTVATQEINPTIVIYKLWDGFQYQKAKIERLSAISKPPRSI